jgi:hypothetical protein
MKKNYLPPGWTENKIKRVIKHYEDQTPAEATDEDESAYQDRTQTFMEIPNRLVPSVRKLLARHTGE